MDGWSTYIHTKEYVTTCAMLKVCPSPRNWFIEFSDILLVVVMLYLWVNCWSLSLWPPNSFYILLLLLVLSKSLWQFLLKKGKKLSTYRSSFTVHVLLGLWFILPFSCLGCQERQETQSKYFLQEFEALHLCQRFVLWISLHV